MSKQGYPQLSLRRRVFIIFTSVLLLMVLSFIFVTYQFITKFTQKQLDTEYVSNLTDTCDNIENTIWNLTLTSQQIIDSKDVWLNIEKYQNASNNIEKKDSHLELYGAVTTLTFGNTDIGLINIYDLTKNEMLFSSLATDSNAPTPQPVLHQSATFTFTGPHDSKSSFIGGQVIRLDRHHEYLGRDIVISIESGLYSLDNPFNTIARKSAYLAFTNQDGTIIFSNAPEDVDVLQLIADNTNNASQGYHVFSKSSTQGWGGHIIVPKSIYSADYTLAIREFIICTILIAVIASLLVAYFGRGIYRPLRLLDKQLN